MYCTIYFAVSGLKVAHQRVAGTSVPLLTLPFLDAEQLAVPLMRTEGMSLSLFVQLWKFRSPVVLQRSDIILASILRIASPRNVGGLGFSSFVGFKFTFANSVSISFCKVRHIYFFFPA